MLFEVCFLLLIAELHRYLWGSRPAKFHSIFSFSLFHVSCPSVPTLAFPPLGWPSHPSSPLSCRCWPDFVARHLSTKAALWLRAWHRLGACQRNLSSTAAHRAKGRVGMSRAWRMERGGWGWGLRGRNGVTAVKGGVSHPPPHPRLFIPKAPLHRLSSNRAYPLITRRPAAWELHS